MIRSDFHTHTAFSTDSKATPESMIEGAIAKGLRTLCITDHMDYDYPGEPGEFVFEPTHYFDTFTRLKEIYRGKIDLRIGIELGLRNEPELYEQMRNRYNDLLRSYPFDFVIGSTHCLQNTDPYYRDYWEQGNEDGVLRYFEANLFNATEYDGFQVFGHLDYVLRYMPDGGKVSEALYKEVLHETLRALIARGKGIEVNTNSLRNGLIDPHPGLFALKEYLALGGEILTIGSDAHKPEHLAYEFERTAALLQSLGYRYYTTFEKQRPSFHRLDG